MAQEGKYKYLAKNIGLLTLSSFTTKLLSFFLVPLYTNILTTEEYGIYDLMNTTIGILIPILTLNILEAVIRFSMEKDANNDAITSVSAKFLSISSIIVIIGLFINHILKISSVVDEFSLLFFLLFFSQTLSGIVTAYARGSDHIVALSISSVISSAVIIGSNLLFLVVFKWGLIGYFWANIIGPFMQSVYLLLRTGMVKHLRLREKYEDEKERMLAYSKPLIANSIAWWVNNVSDRYVVTFFLGLSENGIYSVASKIPSILNILQSIFNQAWTLSAVKDFDPEDKSGFFKNTYALYNAIMVVGCSGIILFNRLLARFLYAKDFYLAWRYVPWLTIAIVFGALSGYLGGFFSAVKDSKIFAQSTAIGAVSNIILNLIFTPIIGALGAAIATTLCYVIVWLMRLYHSRRYIKLHINLKRDIFTYILLVAQSVIFLVITDEEMLLYGFEGALFCVIVISYWKEVVKFVKKVVRR